MHTATTVKLLTQNKKLRNRYKKRSISLPILLLITYDPSLPLFR